MIETGLLGVVAEKNASGGRAMQVGRWEPKCLVLNTFTEDARESHASWSGED